MVHVYLSLDKVAMKLAHVGLLGHWREMRVFAQHFNINQPLFSVIDVGQGKERADHKIKGTRLWLVQLNMLTCSPRDASYL